MNKIIVAVLLCSFLAGCAEPIVQFNPETDLKTNKAPGVQQIYNLPALTVDIDSDLRDLIEKKMAADKIPVELHVGNLINRLFVQDFNSLIKVGFISSDLNYTANWMSTWNPCTLEAKYELIVEIQDNTGKDMISLSGSDCSDGYASMAGKRAVEKAVFKLYKIIEQKQKAN